MGNIVHHLDILLHALSCDQRGQFDIGIRISIDAPGFRSLPGNDDVAAFHMESPPVVFHDGFEGNETAGDDGEDHQENAGARVCTGRGWYPCRGEEGSGVRIGEDHVLVHGVAH